MTSAEGEPNPLSPEFLRKLEYLRVVARRTHAGRFAALNRSRKLGRGMDFADHRPYTPGDDFKDIDWNLFGRLDRLMVRLAQEDTELNIHLLVDCSRSMSAPPLIGLPGEGDADSKDVYVRKLAAALSYVALAHLDRVHIYPFGETLLRPLTPPRHKAQAIAVYRYLQQLDGGSDTRLEDVTRAFAGVERSRGIALVISDFLSPGGWETALDVLRSARFEVGMLHVTSPAEATVAVRGEVMLRDHETGRNLRVRVTDRVAAAYRQAFLDHGASLQRYARHNNLFYAHAPTDQPFEEAVLHTLRGEGVLA